MVVEHIHLSQRFRTRSGSVLPINIDQNRPKVRSRNLSTYPQYIHDTRDYRGNHVVQPSVPDEETRRVGINSKSIGSTEGIGYYVRLCAIDFSSCHTFLSLLFLLLHV